MGEMVKHARGLIVLAVTLRNETQKAGQRKVGCFALFEASFHKKGQATEAKPSS